MKASAFLRVLLLAWVVVPIPSRAGAGPAVTHVVAEDETAWFIASVYYGSGTEFPKLLKANSLSRPEDMKQGMEIRIENPKHTKQQAGFSERYARLWEARQKALGLQVGSPLPDAKVVIPTQSIRNQDNTPTLPFTEVKEAGRSPAERAREDLRQTSGKRKVTGD